VAAAATTVRLALETARLRRRRRLISTGVGSLLRDLYLMASGGDTAARCLSQCVERTSEPVRSLIAPALIAVQTGRGLYQALADVAELTTAAAYRDLLQIAWLHSETGASFASMLAENVERREESAMLLGELDAKMGEARWTARILALVPVAVAVYTLAFSPFSVGPMLADPTGKAALVIGSGLWAAGLVAVWRMQIPPTGFGVDE